MSNAVETYMPLVIEKYLGDTAHLTTLQHGAYLLLLMAYWRRGGPLPADDARLAATARMTPAEWRKSRAILAEFFDIGGGVWRQKRADAELERARKKSGAAAASARARWGRNASGDANALRPEVLEESGGNAPPSKSIGDTNVSPHSAPKSRRKPELRLPSDWLPKPSHLDLAIRLNLTAEHVPRLVVAMRDWATAHDHRRADWDATFNTFIRREAENGGKSGQHGGSGSPANGKLSRADYLGAALASCSGGGGEAELWGDPDSVAAHD